MRIIKLNFDSPLHIGEIGIGLEECSSIIHSDTIFNAIVNAYALMHTEDETDEFLNDFEGVSESVRISSAFPYSADELFFPRPRIKLKAEEGVLFKYNKELKRTDFVSKEHFERLINRERFDKEDIEGLVESRELYKEYQIPKVYLDRETRKSDFFFISMIEFKEGCGLWFAIECEEAVYSEIKACLRLLQDEGIGGKRTWGYGLFTFDEDSIGLRLPEKHDLYMLLSLFYPGEGERGLFRGEKSSWDFVVRGGYTGTVRKLRIRMIKEGSVFEEEPKGEILKFEDLKSRCYGIAYSIPVRGECEGEEDG